jgi:hypothetical protein
MNLVLLNQRKKIARAKYISDNCGPSKASWKNIVADRATLFRHSSRLGGTNDEKVGLLCWLPGIAAAAQPDPELLSSFGLSGLKT